MRSRQDKVHGATRSHPAPGDATRPKSPGPSFESAVYHPTSVFSRLLNESARVRKSTEAAAGGSSPEPADGQQAPRSLDVPRSRVSSRCRLRIPRAGRAADPGPSPAPGRLALPDGQPAHRVDGPVSAPLLIVPLAAILVWPALALLAWRSRRGRLAPPPAVARAWGWAGTVLGALLSRPTPGHVALSTRRRCSPWHLASVFDSGTRWFARTAAGVASSTRARES